MSEFTTTAKRSRSIPAWLMSGGFHVLGLLAVALLTNSVMRAPAEIEERPVGIVLARTSARDIDYLGEVQEAPTESADRAEPANRGEKRLPSADVLSEMTIRELALPRTDDGEGLATQGIVQTTDLSALGTARIPGGLDASALRGEQEALRKAKGARGPLARIRLFGGAPATGRSFVFLIDRSKSMGSQGLGALAAARVSSSGLCNRWGPSTSFKSGRTTNIVSTSRFASFSRRPKKTSNWSWVSFPAWRPLAPPNTSGR